MKWLLLSSLAVVLSVPLTAQTAPSTEDGGLSQLVETVLHQLTVLHSGMPRNALESLFEQDGGLQFGSETRYDYRRCPSIKIKVKFKWVAGKTADGFPQDRADDIIVEISQPYLEFPFKD